MRADQVEHHDSDDEGENEGDDGVVVPCLAVAGNLLLRGFDVAVGGDGAIPVPAQREAGDQEHEYQSIGGRTHKKMPLAGAGRPAILGADQVLEESFSHETPYRPGESPKAS